MGIKKIQGRNVQENHSRIYFAVLYLLDKNIAQLISFKARFQYTCNKSVEHYVGVYSTFGGHKFGDLITKLKKPSS